MKKSCDLPEKDSPAWRQVQVQSRVLACFRGALFLLCLAAWAGLFLFPGACVPLGLSMALSLVLWIGSYLLEAVLLFVQERKSETMRCTS